MEDSRITIDVKVKYAPKRISVALSPSDWTDIQIALGRAKRQTQESIETWRKFLAIESKDDGSPRFQTALRNVQYCQQEIENMERIINEITCQLMPGIETARKTAK